MKVFCISIFLFASMIFLYAQEDEQLLVSEIKQSTIVTQPSTLNKGFFRAGTVFSFLLVDKIFNNDGRKEFVLNQNSWAMEASYNLDFQYGITNRLQINLGIPYIRKKFHYSSVLEIPSMGQTNRSSWKLKGKGIGDIEIGAYYQLIEGSKVKPSLVSRIYVSLPTGKKNPTNVVDNWEYDLPTGYGESSVSLDLIYRKITYPSSYSFYAGLIYHFKGEKIMQANEDPIKFKSANRYSFGGIYSFLLNDWLAIQNDLYISFWGKDKFYYDPTSYGLKGWAFQNTLSFNFQFKKFRFAQGVSIPLKGKNSGADPIYILITQYIF